MPGTARAAAAAGGGGHAAARNGARRRRTRAAHGRAGRRGAPAARLRLRRLHLSDAARRAAAAHAESRDDGVHRAARRGGDEQGRAAAPRAALGALHAHLVEPDARRARGRRRQRSGSTTASTTSSCRSRWSSTSSAWSSCAAPAPSRSSWRRTSISRRRRIPMRKLRELLIARRLEAELSKQRILELYLNVIEWGDGIYGAEAAARTLFREVRGRARPAGVGAAGRRDRQPAAAGSRAPDRAAAAPSADDPAPDGRGDAAAGRRPSPLTPAPTAGCRRGSRCRQLPVGVHQTVLPGEVVPQSKPPNPPDRGKASARCRR